MPRRPISISPSLLAADFACLGDEVRRAEDAGADWLHVDVMDGHFVPNLTIGPVVVEALAKRARVPLDVHLMIADPRRYARAFVQAGAHVLTFHVETTRDADEARDLVAHFRAEGVRVVGVSLNPDCPVERVLPLLPDVDLVLVMSVFAGFGGQRFLAETLAKTRAIRATGWGGYVEMDGGLNAETIPPCAAAGADVLVCGTALFGAPDLREALTRFRAAAEAARGETIHA